MAGFSASDAALTGFRIVREHPRALMIWIGIQLVLHFGMGAATVQLAGPLLARLSAEGASTTHDPAQALAILSQLAPFYLLVLAFSLIVYPIFYATMDRAVLRPDEEGFGYIRLGADELRQMGLFLLIVGVVVLAYIALIIAMVAIIAPVAAITGAGRGGASSGLPAGMVAVLLVLAAIGLWIYVWVRLSLASPLTFASRRIDLFGSWRLTRGLFWPMFGTYFIAAVLALIVSLLTLVIASAASATVGGGFAGLQVMLRPDTSSLAAYMTPARIISLAIDAVSSALVWPVMLTPAAAIYRSLAEAGDAQNAASPFG